MSLGARLSELLSRIFGRNPARSKRVRVSHMPGGDQVVWGVEGSEMEAAMAAARATLPVFWNWHETRPEDPDCCALKVGVPNSYGGSEHLWFIDILRSGDVVTGIVASEPESVQGLEQWRPAAIDINAISDWYFQKDGLNYGHFTTRALAAMYPDKAPPDWDRDLSPTPLPADLVRH